MNSLIFWEVRLTQSRLNLAPIVAKILLGILASFLFYNSGLAQKIAAKSGNRD